MNALGRGLAALIPNRGGRDPDEVIETMENVKDEPVKKSVSVLEEFEEFDEVESTPAPSKPLVTPITIDPDAGAATTGNGFIAKSVTVKNMDDAEEEVSEPAPEQPEVSEPESQPVEVTEEETPAVPEGDGMSAVKKVAKVKKSKKVEPKEAVAVHTRIHTLAETKPAVKKSSVVKKPVVEKSPIEKVAATMAEEWDRHEDNVQHIAIGDISINPLQPRRSFDPEDMEELKASMEMHGLLQPLVVRRLEKGKYELIAGERRLRASKALNWTKVPCVVRRNVAADDTRLVYALVENIQRENLNPVEEARAYDQLNTEYGLTHEEIGQRVGKTRVRITNIMRVLKLPAEIQRGLSEGKITSGHAKAILMIPNSEKQLKFYQHMLEEGLTVRKSETRARRIQRSMNITDGQRKRIGTRHPLAQRYSPMLEDRYGYDARIKYNEPSNRFEIVFRAHNSTELEELVGRMMGTVDLPYTDEGLAPEDE